MRSPRFGVLALATLLVLPRPIGPLESRAADAGASEPPADVATTAEDLAPVLEPIRREYGLPGLVAAVVRGDKVVAAGAVGVREVGKGDKVELGDRFHIGSCTKTMTAMLVARLVDQGKLTWDTTLAGALPGVEMRPEYRPVTIRQLLTFRGGLPPYTLFRPGDPASETLTNLKGDDPADVRLQFARAVLNEPPVAPPGTKAVYSNASFAVAGAIIDRLAGRPWEVEIEQGLFRPLGMTASAVAQPHWGRNDQPVGHRKMGDAFRPARPPMTEGPVRHVTAPAGHVSCSILDFARYASARLAGLRGKGPLLSAEAYTALATPVDEGEGFTGGTGRLHPLGKAGREFLANGSGGLFFAGVRLLPDQGAAIVVATNAGAAEAVEAAVAALKERFQLPR
jgi:CubicO group peptidase (beta-lactamase class C family)